MNFIERNDQFSENLMLADDQGNRITYGEFEKIYEERSKFLEEGRLAFLYCRNTVGAVLYYRSCLRNHVVPLLLEHRMDRELLRTLIGTYEPDYLSDKYVESKID